MGLIKPFGKTMTCSRCGNEMSRRHDGDGYYCSCGSNSGGWE